MTLPESFADLESGLNEFEQAEKMAEWFPDYLYTLLDKPKTLPKLAADRLTRHFADMHELGLDLLRDEMLIMPRSMHQDVFLYLCGYPEWNVREGSFSDVRALLDERFPPIDDIHDEPLTVERPPEMPLSSVRHFLPLILMQGERWKKLGACRRTNEPDAFFPKLDDPAEEQLKICASCDVREQCLNHALKHNEVYGVWGGKTADERRALQNQGKEQRLVDQAVEIQRIERMILLAFEQA